MQRAAALVVSLAMLSGSSPCSRTRRSATLSLTISAMEMAPPPDAGPWMAKLVASKTTSEPKSVAVVREAIHAAESKAQPQRCSFLERGDPPGLRFDLSDHTKVYLYGGIAVAMTAQCHAVDAGWAEKLRTLAHDLGVANPERLPGDAAPP